MAKITPTQRTLRALRHQGRICFIVERFNPHVGPCGIRQDGLGFIDLIALDPERGIIAVQSCGQSFAQHYRKLTESDVAQYVLEWLKSGGRVELWSWRKIKAKRGGKAMIWQPRVEEITEEQILGGQQEGLNEVH